MKRLFLFSFILCLMLSAASMLQANDYLEVQRHYQVYSNGRNSIHFKIPVWAYGRINDYHLDSANTVVRWQVQGESVEEFMNVGGPASGDNRKSNDKGNARVKMRPKAGGGAKGGVIVVTNEYNGNRVQIDRTDVWTTVQLKQVADDDCSRVTILEFDWYPPAELNNKKFKISIQTDIRTRSASSADYNPLFTFSTTFTGGENTTAPQLYTPYLYMVNEAGFAGRGLAAVPYYSQAKPIAYTNPLIKDTILVQENSGTMYVPTSDTGYYAFDATFKVYRNEETNDVELIRSKAVHVPAYHRIYDFQGTAEQDEHGSFTGANILTWKVKSPDARDLIPGDYFELQRAFQSDFSDAQTVRLEPMTSTDSIYRYVDDNRTAWNGTELRTDTIDTKLSYTYQGYELISDDNVYMAYLDVTLTAKTVVKPSAPVYYRIRRTSSAIWEWEHDFAKSYELNKSTYLAPLKQKQPDYRLDPDFGKNKKLHFTIELDNMEIGPRPLSIDDCELTYRCKSNYVDNGFVNYIVDLPEEFVDDQGNRRKHGLEVYIYAVTRDGKELYGPRPGKKAGFGKTKFRVPLYGTVERLISEDNASIQTSYAYGTHRFSSTYIYPYKDDRYETFLFSYRPTQGSSNPERIEIDTRSGYRTPTTSPAMDSVLALRENQLKQQLYVKLNALNGNYGRCTWDKTAQLILRRTMVETGQSIDLIVPQDSIVRQADGSWRAHMTDIADAPCTHYTYQVLIDQSHATLRVVDSVYLLPKTISGTKFYVNEAAGVTSFSASQGDARGRYKSGVQLRWEVSSLAVDSFVLRRVPKNSSDAPEVIYIGEDNHFFDETAVPGRQYEYTVSALYTCNGNATTNSKTADGYRSPYGQIGGTIQMPDNAGMAGVEVSLSVDGQTLKTVTTGATGAFLFDSLAYDLSSGTVYTVMPTSQYGVFSYNNTSSGMATIALDAAHAISEAVNFVNTSTVRLSGRVLYDFSTIPVAEACFVLNGATILRGNKVYRTGADGTFELIIPKSMPCRLQVAKEGHTFKNGGWLMVTDTDTTFSLVKALDGVRFYDDTKVRLVGRVAGGNDQRDLPHGLGLGKNNLGDDLQLVLMLEGDNTAHIVHDPDDLTRDTLRQTVEGTDILFEQKRIVIRPDVTTGEYAADLFPVKYKVVQATAKGYATLFPSGTGSETFDLTNAPLTLMTDSLNGTTVQYNAVYDRIYHNPVQLKMTQLLYGMEKDGYGEERGQFTDINGRTYDFMLYTSNNGEVDYTLGYPVFLYNRQYQFMISAFEEYCYNNDRQTNRIDRVPLRSGSVVIRNGLHSTTEGLTYVLDNNGRNNTILLKSDNIDFSNSGLDALRTVSAALQTEGNTVETDLFRAFVSGDVVQSNSLTSSAADIKLLDVIRDPGGMGSSSWLEAGSTYKFGYSSHYHWEFGAEIGAKWGEGVSQSIGVVSAPAGAGTYAGSVFETNRSLTLSLPFTWEWDWTNKYSYEYTTSTRIATSSSYTNVGANADVFLGATRSIITGLAQSVSVISDSLWQARQTAYRGGALKLLAQGTDSDGRTFYLVTGEKTVLGSDIDNTFVYSQKYIIQSVIPTLAKRRLNLLENFASKEAAQEAANERNEPVYWYKGQEEKIIDADTIRSTAYEMFVPQYSSKAFLDEVASLNTRIMNWLNILFFNEKEKVMARMSGQKYGTFSVGGGNAYTRNDSYSYGGSYTHMPQEGLFLYNLSQSGTTLVERLTDSNLRNLVDFFQSSGGILGESVKDVIKDQFSKFSDQFKLGENNTKKPEELTGKTANAQWKLVLEPILSYTNDEFRSNEVSCSRKVGFTLSPDPHGDIAVSVYRANIDKVFYDQSAVSREQTEMENDSIVYGSYVFFTEAGTSYCPHEGEERTLLYNAGTAVLGNGTLYAAKPEISTNTYEQTNVAPDKPAVFRLTLMNNADQQTPFQGGEYMHLSLAGGNPDGAKVFIDGVPIAAGYPLYIVSGSPVVKTMEVYRGQADDYTDMELQLSLDECPKVYSSLKFSVHYLPESSPVQIAFPRDKWVMNTLSARDSIGYYLPVTIDGFDIHHKNFDHIEFQYKLSTENNDAWVTQCAFFADDSLYNKATGNKAMIENGRISPFRFYGERDPKELNYDLRAVSFCRYGSGFVTKESPVISGIKDTRPPVLFDKAQPANGILTLEDNISLRFSEPIAGNWLDEDNNFQLRGVTNATGITQSTSIYLSGKDNQYLMSNSGRELAITDLSVDMMIRPAETGRTMTLFAHGDSTNWLEFRLTADNRLQLLLKDDDKQLVTLSSKPMDELSKNDFTRVIFTYDFFDYAVRFYAGTKDITDKDHDATPYMLQNDVAPLIFGKPLFSDAANFHGNIMEARVWTKVLSPEEINNTHLRRLTGYEHELMDYYPMDEGAGNELADLASGATLYCNALSWTNPQGISLELNGKPLSLKPECFSRSVAQDYTLMGWFRSDNNETDHISLFATYLGDSLTMELGYENGNLFFRQGDVQTSGNAWITNGEWHHVALSVSKAYNVGNLYLDSRLILSFPVGGLNGLAGTRFLVGDGLIGNVDDICLFEQAMPAALVEEYFRSTPAGDEMGLMALLPFSEQKRNASNVMELVFSPNDQRVFRDANGNVVKKIVPLIVETPDAPVANLADKTNYAPVKDRGQLTNLFFNWSYNAEELLINIRMQDREINKRTLYLTVRDVEDINGNRLVSPVTWSVYADLNSLRWEKRSVTQEVHNADVDYTFKAGIVNTTGMTRQYTIDGLPQWLDCSPKQGTMNAQEEQLITFTVKKGLTPGQHNAVIFLTDDNGLSESLVVNVNVLSICPWDEIDTHKYHQNMSLRAQVLLDKNGARVIDTDKEDIVGIFCNGEMIGKGQISAEDFTRGYVFITVYGDQTINGRMLTAQLWRHSTAKTYILSSDMQLRFKENTCIGCPPNEPVHLYTTDNLMQAIRLDAGWNWTSFCLKPEGDGDINTRLLSEYEFSGGDEIKSPVNRRFCSYDDSTFLWKGSLKKLDYRHMYMFYTAKERTVYLKGSALLTDEERTISLSKGWNVMPYLRQDNANLRDALADYYPYATEGDLIKSHDEFAVFSDAGKWEGNLTFMKPGCGYLFYRQGETPVRFTFPFTSASSAAPKSENAKMRKAATNMTIIAKVQSDDVQSTKINVFIGDELVGVAEPLQITTVHSPISNSEAFYFLTIQSDKPGTLRFELDGQLLTPEEGAIHYVENAHAGSLNDPVMLRPSESTGVYKIIENNHVVIIRNNEKYSIDGKKF